MQLLEIGVDGYLSCLVHAEIQMEMVLYGRSVEHGLVFTGTWRTHIAKEESAWCKVGQDVPMEYAATVSVNPCTALRMLDDFVDLKAGQLRKFDAGIAGQENLIILQCHGFQV